MPGAWREEVMGVSGLNVLAGIWLIISPFILDYQSGDAYWNPIICGAIVGLLALARASGAYHQVWMSWVNLAIGVWLFISTWWLADSGTASVNVFILGIIVFLLAAWSIGATREPATSSSGGRIGRNPPTA